MAVSMSLGLPKSTCNRVNHEYSNSTMVANLNSSKVHNKLINTMLKCLIIFNVKNQRMYVAGDKAMSLII